jgi:hypothetical protein
MLDMHKKGHKPGSPSVSNVRRIIPSTDPLDPSIVPVCIRTLTRSKGWPTKTAAIPVENSK